MKLAEQLVEELRKGDVNLDKFLEERNASAMRIGFFKTCLIIEAEKILQGKIKAVVISAGR